jgi:cytochrome c-type biogenesis protein CcmE
MKSYYLIAAVVVIAFIALGASSFLSSMSPYVEDFDKVRTATEDTIQVPGKVIKNKTVYDVKIPALTFYLQDAKGHEMKVVYKGVRPSNFDQADKIVAVGNYRDDAFQAENLIVKCPSKYRD